MTGFQAEAFGTSAAVAGGVVESGRSALAVIGCTSTVGLTHTNTTAGVAVLGDFDTGSITDTVATSAPAHVRTSSASSATESLNIYGGAITATAVEAQASTARASGSGFVNTGATTFVGLTIEGQGYTDTPAPNTRIAVPGVGAVVLNQQTAVNGPSGGSMLVRGLVLTVAPGNSMGLPAGLRIVVSSAMSAQSGPVSGVVDGHAFGTEVTVAPVVTSGPTAFLALACLGTDGAVESNSTTTASVPSLLTTGTVTSTVEGEVSSSSASSATTNTIQSVEIAPAGTPLVSAAAVVASASASKSGGTRTFSDSGSGFVSLSILGVPYTGTITPNTAIPIPGLGTLYLEREIQKPHSLEVRMLELDVTVPGTPVPVGTDLIVADAEASVH